MIPHFCQDELWGLMMALPLLGALWGRLSERDLIDSFGLEIECTDDPMTGAREYRTSLARDEKHV
jgi:hypothetical protein